MQPWTPSRYPTSFADYLAIIEEKFVRPAFYGNPEDIKASRTLNKLSARCNLMLIDGSTPDASAIIQSDGHILIGYTVGLVSAVKELAQLVVVAGLLEDKINPRFEADVPRKRIPTIFWDYSFLQDIPTDTPLKLTLLSSSLTEQQESAAHWLTDFALAWLALHERNHAIAGHLDYFLANQDPTAALELFAQRNRQRQFRNDSERLEYSHEQMFRQGLEVNADSSATHELVERTLRSSLREIWIDGVFRDEFQALRATALAVGVVFVILRGIEMRNEFSPLHPMAATRLHMQRVMLLDAMRKKTRISDQDALAICVGIDWLLDLTGALNRTFSHVVLPSFRGFTAIGDEAPFGPVSWKNVEIVVDAAVSGHKRIEPYQKVWE